MKCPVCGFDASRDYSQYPTFGPLPAGSTDTRSVAAEPEDPYALIDGWKEQLRRQQVLEAELQRKDAIIDDLKNELRQTRASLYAAQKEIEALKNPPEQQNEPPVDSWDIFQKYLSHP